MTGLHRPPGRGPGRRGGLFRACAGQVFVVEQRVPEDVEYDAYDAIALHVLAVGPGGPLGTGRLLYGPGARARTGGLGDRLARPPRRHPRRRAASASARLWCAPWRTRRRSAA